jgi:hypothetical protein
MELGMKLGDEMQAVLYDLHNGTSVQDDLYHIKIGKDRSEYL